MQRHLFLKGFAFVWLFKHSLGQTLLVSSCQEVFCLVLCSSFRLRQGVSRVSQSISGWKFFWAFALGCGETPQERQWRLMGCSRLSCFDAGQSNHQNSGSKKGCLWKRGLFRRVDFLEAPEILEILQVLERLQSVQNQGEIIETFFSAERPLLSLFLNI